MSFSSVATVAFGCEVVMRATVHYIVGELALRQQGIGGDKSVLDIDGIEQAWEHPNFVGLFLLITAFYGQSPDFFWV